MTDPPGGSARCVANNRTPPEVAPPLTDDEVRNRGLVRQLTDGPRGPAAEEELEGYAGELVQAAATGGLEELWDRKVKERRGQVERHSEEPAREKVPIGQGRAKIPI